jgi:ankyrin repeat protein
MNPVSLYQYKCLANYQCRFRWAVCQLDTLGECRTRATLRKSLATLPPTLDKTYDRILSAISEADSQYAVTILQWLTFSIRPLSIYEVAEIVAIDVKNEPKFDCEGILEDPLDVLSICSSLVNITIEERDRGQESGRQVVALAHYSVKEYLLSDRIWKGSAARYGMQDIACHDNIAKGCLGYLLQFQGTQLLTQETAENFKLAKYCAEFWMKHAQGTKEQAEGFSQAAMDLLLGKSDVYLNWLRIHDPDNSWRGGSDFKKDLASVSVPLYYASRFGLRKIVKLLLDRGADVNVQGGDYGNALQAAAFIGHKEMVELLVSKGADVNLQGGHYGNTLQAAACRGHKETVELLVSKGADVNLQGGVYGNALCAAADRGHKEIVELLISKGADVNLQGGFYGNALQAAVDRGHKEIVDLLISKGADVNLQGGFYGNALQAAVDRGHKEIVDLLVSKGADVNLQGGHYGNALQAAAAGSHKETVELLVSKGAVTFEKSIRNP